MLTTETIGAVQPAAPVSDLAANITRVKSKLKEGLYKTEATKCFCGEEDHIIITRKDRYTIPHQMVICKNCGIMRANPRMTAESYAEFYQKDYRDIYDVWEYGNDPDRETIFIKGLQEGQSLYEFIEYFDIHPRVVFDIGCNTGATLMPFKEQGAECYGVDYGMENLQYGKSKGLNLLCGSIDELFKLEKKADLIIVKDVLEHILDIEPFLEKISRLLAPDGLLYIGVPGLFVSDKNLIWQNAHVWQFTLDTLSYVMKCSGYDDYFGNECIQSIWSYTGNKMPKTKTPKHVFANIDAHLQGTRKLPYICTFNKFTFKERKENLDKSLSYKYPDIFEFLEKMDGKEAIIIGGGPSVDNYPRKIKELQQNGGVIFCIERMYQWCFKHDITPDFIVCMDACDDVVEGFKQINPKTKHLLATQCKSDVFEMLKGYDNYVFCLPQKGIKQEEYWAKHNYQHITVVNCGGSVTLGSMALAMSFGIKRLHIFGFDCHMGDKGYADGIAGVGLQKDTFQIKIEDRVFTTNTAYLSFMQQFFIMQTMGIMSKHLDDVRIYGDSMAKHASREDIDGDK